MKRYEELSLYKRQEDGEMVRVVPKFPSQCLSIGLREQGEMEELIRQGRFCWLKNSPHSASEGRVPK